METLRLSICANKAVARRHNLATDSDRTRAALEQLGWAPRIRSRNRLAAEDRRHSAWIGDHLSATEISDISRADLTHHTSTEGDPILDHVRLAGTADDEDPLMRAIARAMPIVAANVITLSEQLLRCEPSAINCGWTSSSFRHLVRNAIYHR